jgi:putative DNA primase/helicase
MMKHCEGMDADQKAVVAAKLKQITGGSKITCRFLYGDEFEYTPEFKLWIATNHKPVIRGTDLGIWRRIRMIPFEVNIPADKVD